MQFSIYILKLSARTVQGLLTSYLHLGFGYPSSVYFNAALMLPMFYDYSQLVGITHPNAELIAHKASALMLLEDIMLDDLHIQPYKIDSLFDSPESFTSENKVERLAQRLLIYLKNNSSNKHIQLLHKLHVAQKQNDHLGKGIWFPALAYSFNPQISQSEEETLQMMGYWIKAIDDLVDLEEDKKNNIHNLLTDLPQEIEPQRFLENLRKEVFNQVEKLPYPKRRISDFIYGMSIATYAFKLHNEELVKSTKWYQKLCKMYQPALFANLVWATIKGYSKLTRIKPISSDASKE